MEKQKYGKTIVYYDEINDDFSDIKIETKPVPHDFNYLPRNIFFLIGSFLLTFFIAIPYFLLENAFRHHIKVYGRRKLKGIKSSFVLYGNHTSALDSWIPQVLISPFRKVYIIAHPDAVSTPLLKVLTVALGALPHPDTPKGHVNLMKSIAKILKRKRTAIAVYPEAHIWPYYTKIRPFAVTSFKYASLNNVPCVPIVTIYKKPKGLFKQYHKPRMNIYIGDPIFPLSDLSATENASHMHKLTREFMESYAHQEDNVAFYNYVKGEKPN
jgi:1-acyl-sn-glycerol-3-phosphate acyltransferase